MFKKSVSVIAGLVLLVSPLAASADTISDLLAQIAAIRAQIAQLQGQGTTPALCVTLTSNQTLGSTGNDVTRLQRYLVNKGHLDAEPTGYYGFMTAQAVGKLQLALGIVSSADDSSYGIMGPRTRAAVKCGNVPPRPVCSPGQSYDTEALGCVPTPVYPILPVTPTSGAAPLTITFTAPSSAGGSYVYFGDGTDGCSIPGVENDGMTGCSVPTGVPLTHTYTRPGVYHMAITRLLPSTTLGVATITVTGQDSGSTSEIKKVEWRIELANPSITDANNYRKYEQAIFIDVIRADNSIRGYSLGNAFGCAIKNTGFDEWSDDGGNRRILGIVDCYMAASGVRFTAFSDPAKGRFWVERLDDDASGRTGGKKTIVLEIKTKNDSAPSFTATPTSGGTPLTVTFRVPTMSAGGDYFDFGDGTDGCSVAGARRDQEGGGCLVPINAPFTHTYERSGTYTVLHSRRMPSSALGTATIVVTGNNDWPSLTFSPVVNAGAQNDTWLEGGNIDGLSVVIKNDSALTPQQITFPTNCWYTYKIYNRSTGAMVFDLATQQQCIPPGIEQGTTFTLRQGETKVIDVEHRNNTFHLTPGSYIMKVDINSKRVVKEAVQFLFNVARNTNTTSPTITSITPTSGPVGTVVTIAGTNITPSTSVRFGAPSEWAYPLCHHTTSGTCMSGTLNPSTRDDRKVIFTVPANMGKSTCTAPNGACTAPIAITLPGMYNVALSNSTGQSNTQTFTVTDESATPTGTLTPTPCTIPEGATTCSFSFSWASVNTPAGIRTTFTPQGRAEHAMYNAGSPSNFENGAGTAGIGTHTIKLFDARTGVLLDTKTVTIDVPSRLPTGSLSPTPCSIPAGATTCSFSFSWTSNNTYAGIRTTFTPQGASEHSMYNDGSPSSFADGAGTAGAGTHTIKLFDTHTNALLDSKQVVISAPVVTMCSTAQINRGKNNQTFTCSCPANFTQGTVWGNLVGSYSDDSHICTAALQAGAISRPTGGLVNYTITAGQSSYTGATANTVTSQSFGAWPGSFRILLTASGATANTGSNLAQLAGALQSLQMLIESLRR